MRTGLKKELGKRKKFRALVAAFGKKVNYLGYSDPTILLKNIQDVEADRIVAEHLWFALSRTFEKVGILEGMTIEFEARVKEYSKGYVNRRHGINNKKQDYKLSHPTNVRIIGQGA
jgi:hypothetical protein